jgi:valyl-tRNA synthetase
MTIEKTYDPAATEAKHYPRWEQSGVFACDVMSAKVPYTIMIPPPNVTGSLHMGHALSYTLQDVLIRYHRMIGRDTLWQPGTDHAGIATQMVVERRLAAQDITRHDLGRDKFLDKVWEWKAESGGAITQQLRRLGASPDWARERFTMDAGLNKAVIKVFVELHKQGLIYKDKRLVNWDPKMLTAISDLEVEQKEIKGNMWHFRYPLADDPTQFLVIATTRPETMLGDGAVAVHPDDERYKHLVGKYVRLPLVDRLIPVIADEYPDPEKGSGAVKITAAHDFNDFAVWTRHRDNDYFKQQKDGGLINLFDQHARLNDNCPELYRGMDRFEARKRVIADLEALELVEKIEPITHVVPHGDRSGVVIEPWLSEQWYVDAATLAKPALAAVEQGKTQFVPEQWANTYYAWMRNIEPWCISRQLWWGHQIPAWYDTAGKIYVAESESEAQAQAGAGVALHRDQDVLDTWFSSALWPFSTLGWPDKTAELARYYPTDVLVTGFDIIFFWVARMMMMGIHFMGTVPFHKVYIHALVRDEKGQKMSKTKGNVIDPIAMIDKYGCDALRFALTALSTPGRDIKLSPARIEGYRNFATKLWNAARFCEMNGCVFDPAFDVRQSKQIINQWIAQKTYEVEQKLQTHYAEHRFDLIAQTLYQFVWNDFCDWYVELAKPILQTEGAEGQTETRTTTAWVLAQMLKFLHPVMPFITEELWESYGGGNGTMLMRTTWPDLKPMVGQATDEVAWLIALISEVRAVRSQLNVPVVAFVTLQVKDANATTQQRLHTHEATIKRLARVDKIELTILPPKQAAQIVLGDVTIYLPLEGIIDLAQERVRLEKESQKLQQEIDKMSDKLAREDFVARAPAEVVDELRQRMVDGTATLHKLTIARKAVTE